MFAAPSTPDNVADEMNIIVEAGGMALTEDQSVGCRNLMAAYDANERALVLTGPAGSGKTTLVRTVLRLLKARGVKGRLCAPTGKAAARIRDVTGEPATTIHKALFRGVSSKADGTPVFFDAEAPCEDNEVLVIDESSMVDTWLYNSVMAKLPKGCAAIWCGDREQLPPVQGTWGPNFDHPTAALTTVCRQALDSPILYAATEIRSGRKMPDGSRGDGYLKEASSFSRVLDRILDDRANGKDTTVLTWRNEMRSRINEKVRKALGRDSVLESGDRLLVRSNSPSTQRMNGEILRVATAIPWVDTPIGAAAVRANRATPFEMGLFEVQTMCGITVLIHPDLLGSTSFQFREKLYLKGGRDPNPEFISATAPYRHLHADYGEAMTVHASQGSEFDHVIFVLDSASRWIAEQDVTLARRLCYTAVTRAKSSLYVGCFS